MRSVSAVGDLYKTILASSSALSGCHAWSRHKQGGESLLVFVIVIGLAQGPARPPGRGQEQFGMTRRLSPPSRRSSLVRRPSAA